MEEIKIIKQKERVTKLEEVSKYLSVLDTSSTAGPRAPCVCVGGRGIGGGGGGSYLLFQGP